MVPTALDACAADAGGRVSQNAGQFLTHLAVMESIAKAAVKGERAGEPAWRPQIGPLHLGAELSL